jgi:PAS domain S-box-containing protein
VAYIRTYRMSSRLKIVLVYAAFSTIWIFGSDRLLTHLVRDSEILGWIGTVKGLVFVAMTSVLLYLLLRIGDGAAISRVEQTTPLRLRRLIVGFVGLALLVPLLGYGIFQLYSTQVREDAFAALDAITALKCGQIESWLAQRYDNAAVLSQDSELARNAALLIRNPGDEAVRERLSERLNAIRQVYGYDTILLDATGRSLLTIGTHPGVSSAMQNNLLPLALNSMHVQRSEFYRDPSGVIHLDYLAPLQHPGTGKGIAAILLHARVEDFLFPLIQRWPTPSASAETLLVRRDGDQVLYLNELRHQHHTALTLRMPLALNTPSATAVRLGHALHIQTLDRRGISVLAASHPVKGTPWFVVAKIDHDEVMAPLKRLILWLSVVMVSAVVALAGALYLLWRQQQRAHHLEWIAQNAERDQLLKLFYDLPFVGMSLISPVTRHWLHANGRLCEIFGYSCEELMRLTWNDLTHPDDLAAEEIEFQRVLQGKSQGYQMDKRFVSKSGAIIDTTINVKVVRFADGGLERVVATVQDITASKLAETVQKMLSDRIEEMLENMIDGFIALDKEWRFIYINRYAAHLLGHEPQDLLGKQIWQIFPEGVDQPFYHAYQRVMAQQIAERVDNYFPPWQRWYENHIYPTQNGISVYFQDITERKAMEASLRESEARFRAIIDSEPECVKIIGPDGKLKFMNQAGLEMIEAASLEQLQGHSVLGIVTPEYKQAFRDLTKQVLQGARAVLEFEIVGLKGTRRLLETHAVALRGSESEPFSLLSITRDITERRKMEDQLHQQLAELLRWQEVMLGREDRVQQLKSEVNNLLGRLGQPLRYPSQAST